MANSDQDCAGECFGIADLDDCGVCSGGTSDHAANSDQDCNGDCFGSSIIDECGICSEGNTGLTANVDQDCNGDCFGSAEIDGCGVCSGGNSDHIANSDDLGGGCFYDAPLTYCEDTDGDGLGNPGSEEEYCIDAIPLSGDWVDECNDI